MMVLSSTIAPGDVTRPAVEPDGEGLAVAGLLAPDFAAVADGRGLERATGGVPVDGTAAADGAVDGTADGVTAALVEGAGATAGAGAPLLDSGGARADETETTGPVAVRLAVQAVISSVGASPSTAARASIRRMRVILPDPRLDCPHCRVQRPRFDPPDGWSVLLGVGALQMRLSPRVRCRCRVSAVSPSRQVRVVRFE